MERNAKLLTPIKIGNKTYKNRIEVAPAAPFLAGRGGSASVEFLRYMGNLAKSGAALVNVGVTAVEDLTGSGARILSAGDPGYITELADTAEVLQRFGAMAGIELVSSRYMIAPPEAINELSTEEVYALIDRFAAAAALCADAGFDNILLHGGHGNVPARFFSQYINKRSDEFGGSFENRCRFAKELLAAVRKAVGKRCTIEYRVSAEEMLPNTTTFEETLAFLKEVQGGIDLLHVSRGILEKDELLPYINAPIYFPRGLNLPFAKKFKEELDIPVAVVGGFDFETAEAAIAAGEVDMVCMIRTILADTDCVNKLKAGKFDEIRPCVRCNTCIGRTHSERKTIRCAVNAMIGRETWFDLEKKAETPKHVVVVGGGPGGMEAARIAAKRGHRVTLLEKEESLGGNLRMAGAAEFKGDIRKYLAWSIRSIEQNPAITLRLGVAADAETVKALRPDAVIVGVGSSPIIPKFTATGTDKVIWVGDAELGNGPVGDRVVIAGAGLTGLEEALVLSRLGKKVTVIDMLPREQVGQGGVFISVEGLEQLLQEAGVEILCSVRLMDVTEAGATIQSLADGKETLLECDTVVMSLGVRANAALAQELADCCDESYIIGDCSDRPGTLRGAVRGGFDAAMRL